MSFLERRMAQTRRKATGPIDDRREEEPRLGSVLGALVRRECLDGNVRPYVLAARLRLRGICVSDNEVHRIYHNLGGRKLTRASPSSPEEKMRIAEQVEKLPSDVPLDAIVDDLGVSRSHIRECCHSFGVDPPASLYKTNSDVREEFREWFEARLGWQEDEDGAGTEPDDEVTS